MQHATAEQQALRDSASRFLAQQCDFARHRRRQQQHPAEFDRALWTRMGELGWLGVMLAEEVGGLGQTPQAALALVEAMGGQFVSEPYAPALAAATKIWRRMFDSEERLAQDALAFMKQQVAERR